MRIGSVFCVSVLVLALSLPATADETDFSRVVGAWDLEIYAEGQYFYLTMVIEETDGTLSGKVSEHSGFFTDSPLSELAFDGEILTCLASVPSPPDGMLLSWWISLEIGEDTAEGSISNVDIGISASISGVRSKT